VNRLYSGIYIAGHPDNLLFGSCTKIGQICGLFYQRLETRQLCDPHKLFKLVTFADSLCQTLIYFQKFRSNDPSMQAGTTAGRAASALAGMANPPQQALRQNATKGGSEQIWRYAKIEQTGY
jgi:hypothetical protein